MAASCLFCAHTNPAGSKYCNECGSPLHLRPCRFCNAINNASAARCHACDAALPSPQAGVDAAPPQAVAEPVTEASVPEVAPTRGPPRRLVQALIVLLVVVAAPSAYFAYWQARDRDGPSTAPPRPAISGDGTPALSGSAATDPDHNALPQPPGGDATTGAATPLQTEPGPLGGTSALLDGGEAGAATATTATPAPKQTATTKSGGKSSAKSSPKSSRSNRAKGTKSGTTPRP